ncbi:hypothetical protein V6Z11_A09G096200 [Gossypium hirsutum]
MTTGKFTGNCMTCFMQEYCNELKRQQQHCSPYLQQSGGNIRSIHLSKQRQPVQIPKNAVSFNRNSTAVNPPRKLLKPWHPHPYEQLMKIVVNAIAFMSSL